MIGVGDEEQCDRCKQHGTVCLRSKGKIRFRSGSKAKYDLTFAADQIWLKTTRSSNKRKFVDETRGVIAGYSNSNDSGSEGSIADSECVAVEANEHIAQNLPIPIQPELSSDCIDETSNLLRNDNFAAPSSITIRTPGTLASVRISLDDASRPQNWPLSTPSAIEAIQPSTDHWQQQSALDDLVKVPGTFGGPRSRLEAILLRYFVEEIARRFDLCDPERHFTQVVPQRARSSPPLLKAILTISCRQLTQLRRHRNKAGHIEWQGIVLSELTMETAVYYHNECIRDLLRLSMHPEQINNEALLVAAIILRTDEEMQTPLNDEGVDNEVFLRMLNMFLEAQIPPEAALPHSSPQIYTAQAVSEEHYGVSPSPSASTRPLSIQSSSVHSARSTYPVPRVPRSDGLRQACFWVALRQELFTSFVKQRPLKFPLSRCEAFRSLAPAEDAVWADRLIIFCADVLEYCFGSDEKGCDPDMSVGVWKQLKFQGDELIQHLPNSFEPIYCRPPDNEQGEIFPEIWYSTDSNVSGTTHFELARILLAIFDPTRPKLGPGYAISLRKLTEQLRAIVLRICGIALSHPQLPTVLNEALMSIGACGEYFDNSQEQTALLQVLDFMQSEHAFPTSRIVGELRRAWDLD